MATEAPPTPALTLTAAELREVRELVERQWDAAQNADLFVVPERVPYWREREAVLAQLVAKLRAAEAAAR